MRAKHISILSKIFAAFWVAVWLIYFSIRSGQPLTADQSWSIIQQGLFFLGLFSPVDISMIVQNIRGDRINKEEVK